MKRIVIIIFLLALFIIPCLFFLSGSDFLYTKEIQFERLVKRTSYFLEASLNSVLQKGATVKLNVPFHGQEHALSCEIASLQMALNYYKIDITENELLKNLPFDTREPKAKDNIWGDPDLGFVGDIDGRLPFTGYGVYEKPINELAQKYKESKILKNGSLDDLLAEINKGRPIIVWGTVSSGKDISWKTKDGKIVKAILGEHARLLVGFKGLVENPSTIILLDPIYGQIQMSKKKFLADWSLLDNKAVVVF